MKARRTRAEVAALREAVLDAWAAGGRLGTALSNPMKAAVRSARRSTG